MNYSLNSTKGQAHITGDRFRSLIDILIDGVLHKLLFLNKANVSVIIGRVIGRLLIPSHASSNVIFEDTESTHYLSQCC